MHGGELGKSRVQLWIIIVLSSVVFILILLFVNVKYGVWAFPNKWIGCDKAPAPPTPTPPTPTPTPKYQFG